MKTKAAVFIFLIISFCLFHYTKINAQEKSGKYVIVVHGGAGYMPDDLPDSIKSMYFNSLTNALIIGKKILSEGGSSLDAVEKVVNYLEDDSLFNAGKGAVYNANAIHELDASIMFGKDLSCGAVAGVTKIKNPISFARKVMENTPHVLFAGSNADELGKKLGMEIVDNSYFNTIGRYRDLIKSKEKEKHGTVGCVALDQFGNISAATSTGGRTNKMPGRVGDSPLINAGTYANNKTCGVSATGWGELFIKNTVSFNISALMEYKGFTLKQACDEMIYNRLPEDSGGIIALDKDGNYEMPFNTFSMMRGVATSEGIFEISIWK